MKQQSTKRTLPERHKFQGSHIILGITGSIAAYKSAELARLLIKNKIEVQVVMTEAACHFISPTTMQGLSGRPVFTDQWDPSVPNSMAHINLSRSTDMILIAPASADFIAKLSHGLADDLLSSLCLASNCPLIVAPAMNREMWLNAATQRNIRQLIDDGIKILGPGSGDQACGEEGMGRMLEAAQLAQEISGLFQPRKFSGKRILITAGPTYEAIDPVRGITNLSSGKMGYAVARAALEQGADVILVSGPTSLSKPQGAQCIDVTSAEEMFDAVKELVADCDIFIGVAAVADYRVKQSSAKKIKKSADNIKLELVPNPDILGYVASLPNPPYCVGFAAETEDLAKHAEQKRLMKKLQLLVGNIAQQSIGSDESELVIFDDGGSIVLPYAHKLSLARQLLQHIAQRCKEAGK